MGTRNISLLGTATTISNTGTSTTGTAANTNDGSSSTYLRSIESGNSPGGSVSLGVKIDFPFPTAITSLDIRWAASSFWPATGDTSTSAGLSNIVLYFDGGTSTVVQGNIVRNNSTAITTSISGSWESVTGISATIYGSASRPTPYINGYTITCILYEISCYAETSPIRLFDGNSILEVIEGDSSSPLRVSDGITTKFIKLVESTDSTASNTRVVTSNGTKSISVFGI